MLNKCRVALFFGTVAALVHAVWAILVAGGWAQSYLNWVLEKHFLNSVYTVNSFDFANAAFLVVMAFVMGNVAGYVLSLIHI